MGEEKTSFGGCSLSLGLNQVKNSQDQWRDWEVKENNWKFRSVRFIFNRRPRDQISCVVGVQRLLSLVTSPKEGFSVTPWSASETGSRYHCRFHLPSGCQALSSALRVFSVQVTALSSQWPRKEDGVVPTFCVMLPKHQEVVSACSVHSAQWRHCV